MSQKVTIILTWQGSNVSFNVHEFITLRHNYNWYITVIYNLPRVFLYVDKIPIWNLTAHQKTNNPADSRRTYKIQDTWQFTEVPAQLCWATCKFHAFSWINAFERQCHQVTSVKFHHNKPPPVIWVISLIKARFTSVFTPELSAWAHPHVWRHSPTPPPPHTPLHLLAYTALLIGELLSFLCLDSRKASLPRSTSPTQKKNRKTVLRWCHNSAGGVRGPFGPHDHIWRVEVGTMT